MNPRIAVYILLAWLLTAIAGFAQSADDTARHVVILANLADSDSMRIARHYASARGLPESNILAWKMPLQEEISWTEFVSSLWQPLQDALVERHWIDGIPMEFTDPTGRKRYAMNGHRIAAIVVCRGVPLKFTNTPALLSATALTSKMPELRSTAAAVDSELALLAHNAYDITAVVGNPLYENEHPTVSQSNQVICVGRLDGPTVQDAMELVDQALEAERVGLIGRAYIDLSGKHPDGDRWLESAAMQVAGLGYDVTIDRPAATMPATARADAPAIYLGWYTSDLNGPFALPGFRFPNGAIALHIHSFSASTLHSPTIGWTGPLIGRGAAVTFGNVYEPYLQLTLRPDLLMRALARGATVGDAALFALPVLSWQSILVGDPLYKPFAAPLSQQWLDRDKVPAPLFPYLVLRRMHYLDAQHREAEAIDVGLAALREKPSLALALTVAEHLRTSGDTRRALAAMAVAVPLPFSKSSSDWGMEREAAQFLHTEGRAADSVALYEKLFAQSLPKELREAWLGEAAIAAKDVDPARSKAWAKELEKLTAPPARLH